LRTVLYQETGFQLVFGLARTLESPGFVDS